MNARTTGIARTAVSALGIIIGAGSSSIAQTQPAAAAASLPRTEAGISEWDVGIVRRAASMLATPSQWNRSDASPCSADAKSASLRCALERASDEAVGSSMAVSTKGAPAAPAPRSDCRLTIANGRAEGGCGKLFDEATVFSIERAKAITTGAWRTDSAPREVWAGQMINAVSPVLQQARKLVDSIAPGKYRRARLAEFNDDSAVTFANLQAYFRSLEGRVRKLTPDDLRQAADDVEIELYSGGAGVMRTYNGWYAVSGFSVTDSLIHFQVDTAREIAVNALDRQILKRADALLSSDAVWNRADNRECDVAAKTWSIYCALELATREVTGGFHHRRPALELVRVIVEERTKGRDYNHRLMDYNNDPTTHLADVRALFAAALAR